MKRNKLMALLILLSSCFALILAGCENKNSRAWIENKISAVEKVYPTENLYDLFEEFPDGFTVKVNDLYKKDGKSYSRDIILVGNPDTREIKGKVSITLLESEPVYKETLIKRSGLEYSKAGDFILTTESTSTELFLYKERGFLIQQLTLNKKVLSEFDLEETYYNWQSELSFITYRVRNRTVNRYFSLKNDAELMMECYPSRDESDFLPSINFRGEGVNHSENISLNMEEGNE